jgi:hypothetical protein
VACILGYNDTTTVARLESVQTLLNLQKAWLPSETSEVKKLNLHLTDIRTFKECRRKFKYAVVDRLVKLEEPSYFSFGRYGHKLLADNYSGQVTTENIELTDEDRAFCDNLYEMYTEFYAEKDKNWNVVSVEDKRTINFNGVDITFTIDLIVKQMQKLFIVDHKFLQKKPNAKLLEIDEQLVGYTALARLLGLDIYGAIYNVIVKRDFEKPEPLAKGNLSRAQPTLDKTTYKLYLEAIHENGLKEADYEKELDMLRVRGYSEVFYRMPSVCYNDQQTNAYLEHLTVVLDDIKACEASPIKFYPAPSYTCAGCQFFGICKAQDSMCEKDFAIIRGQDFRVKSEDER